MKIGLAELWAFGSVIFTIVFMIVVFGGVAR
jgi:hypothetical protein